jgi:hypothetical protein
VNQRDLVTFDVDTERAVRMAPLIPPGVVRVAESGITGPADATTLAAAGYDALLVGETLVRAGDPASAVAALRVPRTAVRLPPTAVPLPPAAVPLSTQPAPPVSRSVPEDHPTGAVTP